MQHRSMITAKGVDTDDLLNGGLRCAIFHETINDGVLGFQRIFFMSCYVLESSYKFRRPSPVDGNSVRVVRHSWHNTHTFPMSNHEAD